MSEFELGMGGKGFSMESSRGSLILVSSSCRIECRPICLSLLLLVGIRTGVQWS